MNEIVGFLQNITLLSIVKFLIVTLLAVYAVFAFLMMQQIRAMTRAISMRDDYVISLIGLIHLAAALMVLVIAIVVL